MRKAFACTGPAEKGMAKRKPKGLVSLGPSCGRKHMDLSSLRMIDRKCSRVKVARWRSTRQRRDDTSSIQKVLIYIPRLTWPSSLNADERYKWLPSPCQLCEPWRTPSSIGSSPLAAQTVASMPASWDGMRSPILGVTLFPTALLGALAARMSV